MTKRWMRMQGTHVRDTELMAAILVYGLIATAIATPFIAVAALFVATTR